MRLTVPEELHRNAPDVHVHGPENTGTALIQLVVQRLGITDLSDCDVLDIGCGVRLAMAILNREIPIRSYTGVDVHRPLIEYLQRHVQDPRFTFAHWDARNRMYNPGGFPITPDSQLPISGLFDIVWLFSVFTHLDPSDASAMLAMLRRHIRLSGAIFFSAFIDNTIECFEDRVPDQPLSQAHYSERYMRQLLESNGWRVGSVNPKSEAHFIQGYIIAYPA